MTELGLCLWAILFIVVIECVILILKRPGGGERKSLFSRVVGDWHAYTAHMEQQQQSVEPSNSNPEFKYQKCVEWLPDLSVVKLEIAYKCFLPLDNDNMEKNHNSIMLFAKMAKESVLTEIALDSVACKMKDWGTKPKRNPRFMGTSYEGFIYFTLNVTAIDREDADVNILHVDKLQESICEVVWRHVS